MKKDLNIVRYNPKIDIGLNDSQIKERQENRLINRIKNSSEKSYFRIIFDNIFTFFNIMMIFLSIILVITQGMKIITNLSFLLILLCNTVIGIYQECKCKRTLSKLKLLNTSKINVIRNSKIEEVLPSDIYLDDIIILKPGDQVPADCIIQSDNEYEINESLMTGESCAVKKKKGDLLLAGSYIITGKIYCRVDKIGKDTYLYSIENKARGFKKPKSKLMLALNKIIKILVLTAIPIALLVFWQELTINSSLLQADIESGATIKDIAIKWGSFAIIYAVPAGMLLLASISMMVSVIKLAQKKTLTQDLYSVEALSRIDTLCLDKTGTLTDGTMTVEKVIYYNKDLEKNGIINSYLSAFDTDNQTSKALINKFGNDRSLKILKSIPFSSDRKYSLVEFEDEGIYILGAPEYLTDNKDILKIVEEYTTNGSRVVILTKINKKLKDLEHDKILSNTKQVMAMFILRDNIRKGVQDTLQWFRENDVDIRVISGDNVKTVSYIAKQSGIKNWNKYVDLSKVDFNNKEKVKEIILKNWIYGRVSPEQKAIIVDILKEAGHVVGMTGDGVNDVISLKKSDCAIALGSGAPATKNISNFVLLDDDFNHMKDAVLQGRGVINNVQRTSTLFIMKNILWMIMMIIPLMFNVRHVYESTVIELVNLLITGIASFFLALEPNTERIKGNFYHTVVYKALIAGIYLSLPMLFIYIYSFITGGLNINVTQEIISSMTPILSICVTIAGFIIFFNICKPFSRYRRILFISILIITLLLLFSVPDFFLINGTEYMQELLNYGSFIEAIRAIFTNMFSLSIYKTFSLDQWIFIGVFLLLSSTFYILTSKIVSKIYEIRNRKEDEEKEWMNISDVFDKIKNKINRKK